MDAQAEQGVCRPLPDPFQLRSGGNELRDCPVEADSRIRARAGG